MTDTVTTDAVTTDAVMNATPISNLNSVALLRGIKESDDVPKVITDAITSLPDVYPTLTVEHRIEFANILTTRKNWSQKATQVLANYDKFKTITDKDWRKWKQSKQYQQQQVSLTSYFTNVNNTLKTKTPATKRLSVTAQLENTKNELTIARNVNQTLIERIKHYESQDASLLEKEIEALKKEIASRDATISSKDEAIQSLREEMCELRQADA